MRCVPTHPSVAAVIGLLVSLVLSGAAWAQGDVSLLGQSTDGGPAGPIASGGPGNAPGGPPPAQARTGEPVDAVSGKLFRADVDLEDPGPLLPVVISRYYETGHVTQGSLGWGWHHAYDRELIIQPGGKVARNGADGTRIEFTLVTGEAWSSGWRLSTTPDGYREEGQDAAIYGYDTHGRLAWVADRSGNRVTLRRDGSGKLTAIEAPGPRVYQVAWDGDRIVRIKAPQDREVDYRYDAEGNLVAVEGSGAAPHRYRYDEAHRLTAVADALGTLVAYTFDAQGRVKTTADTTGATTQYLYDPSHRTSTEIDALGAQKKFLYNAQGLIVEIRDRLGGVSTYAYDEHGLLVQRGFPDGGRSLYEHDAKGRLTVVTDPAGRRTSIRYDERSGNPKEVEAPGGLTTRFSYDDAGHAVKVIGVDGSQRTAAYDARGLVTRLEDAGGRVQILTYDDQGNLSAWKDPQGRVTHYKFDALGRPEAIIRPGGLMLTYKYDVYGRIVEHVTERGLKYKYAYDRQGNVIRIDGPDDNVTRFSYARIGYADRLASETDPTGQKTTYGYDALGQLAWMEDAQKRRTTIRRDAEGRPVSLVDGSGAMTAWDLDPVGRLQKLSKGREGDRLEQVTAAAYTYDGVGRVLTQELVGLPKLSYTYDDAGLTARITGPEGRTFAIKYAPNGLPLKVRTFDGHGIEGQYDQRGLLTRETWADAGLTSRYSYTDSGQLASYVDQLGAALRLDYAKDSGLLTQVHRADGTTLQFAYNRFGDLVKEVDEAGRTTVFERDVRGRITAKVDPMGRRTTYVYDRFGRLTSFQDPEGKTTLAYDNRGRLTTLENPQERITRTYDEPGGTLTQVVEDKTLKQRIPVTVRYTTAGELAAVDLPGNLEIKYERDILGNVTRLVGPGGKAIAFRRTAGRSAVIYPNGIVGLLDRQDGRPSRVAYGRRTKEGGRPALKSLFEQSYAYDRLGRMSELEDSRGNALHMAYDALSRLTSYTGSKFNGRFEYTTAGDLASAGGEAVAQGSGGGGAAQLDGTGALIAMAKDGTPVKLHYGTGGALVAAERGGATVSYRYGPMGERIGRNGDGYLYVSGHLLARYTDQGLKEVFLPGDGLDETWGRYDVAQRTSEYMHPDPAGSVLAVTGEGGELLANYAYSPFGEPHGKSRKQWDLALGFQGRPYDPVTGLYDFGARSYDPSRACFTSPDPIGIQGGLNRYAFAAFNPYWRQDPLGLFWNDVWDATKYTGSQIYNFGIGVGEGAVDMVEGVAHVIRHPWDTAKGAYCLVTHPGLAVDGAKQYWHTLVDDAYNHPDKFARDMGKLAFNIGTIVVPAAGTAKSVEWARGAELLAEGGDVTKGAEVAAQGARLTQGADLAAEGSELGKAATVTKAGELADTPVSYTYKALRMQGYSHDESVELIQQFAKGENPGGAFGFHFTDAKGAQGITDSGEVWSTNGYLGKGVYYGKTPTPSLNLKTFGWGLGESKQYMIPIDLEDAGKQGALASSFFPPKAGIIRSPGGIVFGQ